jgi:hypothetical protein
MQNNTIGVSLINGEKLSQPFLNKGRLKGQMILYEGTSQKSEAIST